MVIKALSKNLSITGIDSSIVDPIKFISVEIFLGEKFVLVFLGIVFSFIGNSVAGAREEIGKFVFIFPICMVTLSDLFGNDKIVPF